MYVLAILRYRTSLDEVLKVVDAHRAYMGDLKKQGILLASGPFVPRAGGALLLRVGESDDLAEVNARLDAIRDGDPFVQQGIAQYELLPWAPTHGKDDLDRLGVVG